MIKLFNKLELFLCQYWYNPFQWEISINDSCNNECTMVEIGPIGFTVLRGDCKYNELKFNQYIRYAIEKNKIIDLATEFEVTTNTINKWSLAGETPKPHLKVQKKIIVWINENCR